ncbi:MAG: hypothetical protein P1V51_12045 [Deltaproteobacteria bacterium]|nr:hypothetical protein [Deltaproteobacteria bacterium]
MDGRTTRALLLSLLCSLLLAPVAGCFPEGEGDGADGGGGLDASLDAGPGDGGDQSDAGEDGGAADAGAGDGGDDGGTAAADPGAAGPFPHTLLTDSVTRGGRTIAVAAYLPTRSSLSHLILFLPGFQLESSRYAAHCEHLASQGFAVVRADPPAALFSVSHTEMRDDGIAVLDWAFATFGATLTGEVGVGGHSLGGKVATMIAAADGRVSALLALDPVNGGDPISGYTAELPDIVPDLTSTLTIPVGYLGETTNGTGGGLSPACAPLDQNFQTFYESSTGAPWAAEWTLEGADHMDFVHDVSGCGFVCTACPDGTADTAAVQATTDLLGAAFFRRHLDGEAAMDPYLVGAALPAGVTLRF